MKRNFIFVCVGCFVLLLGLLLGACGGAPEFREEPAEAELVVETVVVEMERAVIEQVEAAPPQELAEEGDDTRARALQAPLPQAQRMVIKDAEMELLVDNTDIAVAQVTQITADYGGYIISAQSFLRDDNKFATIRIGVPSGNFETVLNNLRNVAIKVIQETASGKDVTAEYVDLESRLENLEATAARVRTFLEAADTVEEALAVN